MAGIGVDPEIATSTATTLLQSGPIGVVCVILLGVVLILWRALEKERADHKDTAEARLEDVKKTADIAEAQRERDRVMIEMLQDIKRERRGSHDDWRERRE